MKVLKVIVCGLLSSLLFSVLVAAFCEATGIQLPPIHGLSLPGFLLGAGLGLFISWGWLLGGMAGAFIGFYGLLLPLALLWSDRSYEDGLVYLLVSAGAGMLVGGYALEKRLKSRAGR